MGHNVPILGGLWGFKTELSRRVANDIYDLIVHEKIASLYKSDPLKNRPGSDQYFLSDYVWPQIKADSIVHDSFNCFKLNGSPFPTQRVGNCFVGCSHCDPNGTFFKCPIVCRPKNHSDWIYC